MSNIVTHVLYILIPAKGSVYPKSAQGARGERHACHAILREQNSIYQSVKKLSNVIGIVEIFQK